MRMNKFLILLCMVMISLSLISCNNQTDNGGNGNNETKENSVKIKSIDAKETSEAQVSNVKARMRKNRSGITAGTVDGINYIIIYKSQTDITFTITLDNPEAYGIDDIRITCDDADSQIWLTDGNGGGEWQPIRREANGTSVVGWDSSNRYERTYNIRTTSPDAINTFKVVDVRLAGHEKFQSKETGSTDMGNNELHIYKIDDDAFTLNVVENTFDYIKFNFNIKEEYKDIISNFEVKDVEYDEENGYWVCYESKEVEVEYEYRMDEYDLVVKRRCNYDIAPLKMDIDGKTVFSGDRLPIYWWDYNGNELEEVNISFELHIYFNTEIELYFDKYRMELEEHHVSESFVPYGTFHSVYLFKLYESKLLEFGTTYNEITEDLFSRYECFDLPNVEFTNVISSEQLLNDFLDRFTIVITGKSYKLVPHIINQGDTIIFDYISSIREVEEINGTIKSNNN